MRRDWYKVRSSLWTSVSHAHLRGSAYLLLGFLLWIADGDPEWRERGSARLMNADGTPMTVGQIGKIARLRSDACRSAVDQLQIVRTLLTDDDGYLYFPNYREHQEDPSAKRKRKSRASVTVTSGVTVEAEAEAEAEAEGVRKTSNKPTSGVAAKRQSDDWLARSAGLAPTELARTVLGWIQAARKRKGVKVGKAYRATPKRVTAICARIDEGATIEDWWNVIERDVHSTDKRKAERYLTPETLLRPANFERLAGWDHIAVRPMPSPKAYPETHEDRSPDVFPRGRYEHGRWQVQEVSGGPWFDTDEKEAMACQNMS